MFVKPSFQTDDDKSSLCRDRFRLGSERGCLRDALNRIGDVAVCFAEVFRVAGRHGRVAAQERHGEQQRDVADAGERGACGCELCNTRRLADHRYRGDKHANENHQGVPRNKRATK